MPVDRRHAFAGGPVCQRSEAWWPWRYVSQPWAQFDRAALVARRCALGPNAWCVNDTGSRDRILLDGGVICRGLLRIEQFGAGRIHLGERAYIGDDCLLSSAESIEVGADTLIAHGVQMFDNDSHPVDAMERVADYHAVLAGSSRRGVIAAAPIHIGARVWIGFGSIVLKGVRIGDGSVVAAGSVVTRDVPPGIVVAGNPAMPIKELSPA